LELNAVKTAIHVTPERMNGVNKGISLRDGTDVRKLCDLRCELSNGLVDDVEIRLEWNDGRVTSICHR
jgi:hypothetical protein